MGGVPELAEGLVLIRGVPAVPAGYLHALLAAQKAHTLPVAQNDIVPRGVVPLDDVVVLELNGHSHHILAGLRDGDLHGTDLIFIRNAAAVLQERAPETWEQIKILASPARLRKRRAIEQARVWALLGIRFLRHKILAVLELIAVAGPGVIMEHFPSDLLAQREVSLQGVAAPIPVCVLRKGCGEQRLDVTDHTHKQIGGRHGELLPEVQLFIMLREAHGLGKVHDALVTAFHLPGDAGIAFAAVVLLIAEMLEPLGTGPARPVLSCRLLQPFQSSAPGPVGAMVRDGVVHKPVQDLPSIGRKVPHEEAHGPAHCSRRSNKARRVHRCGLERVRPSGIGSRCLVEDTEGAIQQVLILFHALILLVPELSTGRGIHGSVLHLVHLRNTACLVLQESLDQHPRTVRVAPAEVRVGRGVDLKILHCRVGVVQGGHWRHLVQVDIAAQRNTDCEAVPKHFEAQMKTKGDLKVHAPATVRVIVHATHESQVHGETWHSDPRQVDVKLHTY
mmetsp:Transcript_145122/g.404347  ORF Transcript_145122/g.404347 Transcript_145122/m.404347 type:complete len:505 (-) Transcript_145122:443-1957(-)